MRKIISLLTAICFCSVISAQTTEILQQADSAYTADNFQEAAAAYQHVINTEGTSAEILYNLGNCYYRMGELGKSILAYERALRLDPTFEDARNNLEFVNSKIADRPGERGSFVGNALDAVANSAKSNTWAWFGFACFILTLSGVAAYIFSNLVAVRKAGFFGGIVTLIACGAFIYLAFRSASIALADDVAIVTAPSTILSTSPRIPKDRNQEAMLLHEGTRVQILDSVRSTTDSVNALWYDVQVDNAHRAWINASAVEKI